MRGLLALLLAVGCAAPSVRDDDASRNEVIVMGMIHGGHRDSPRYGLEVVKQLLRDMKPDYLLVEIPPDRLPRAQEEFARSGNVTEPRVRIFPEYTDAVFPLTREMEFEIIGCAGWTKAMNDDRRAKLARWKTERPEQTREVSEARARMNRRLGRLRDSPRGIHSDRYDEIVAEGMEPYNRLWNDDLGAGGWDNINAAHYALIARALDAHRGEGKRFVITFGAWHKHWFLRELRQRDDIVVRSARDFTR